jgi:hypothetical protein
MGRRKANNFAMKEPEASGAHAEIQLRKDGGLAMVDLDSTNGTRVNGRRIKRAALADGSEIRIGATVLRLRDREAPTPGVGAPDRSAVLRGGAQRARTEALPKARAGAKSGPVLKKGASAAGAQNSPAGTGSGSGAIGGGSGLVPGLEDASGLAGAASGINLSRAAARAGSGGGASTWIAAGLLVALTLVSLVGAWVLSSRPPDPTDLDPPPLGNGIENWSFEAAASGTSVPPGFVALELTPSGGAVRGGSPETRLVTDTVAGGKQALWLGPGPGGAGVITADRSFDVVSGALEVRVHARPSGRLDLGASEDGSATAGFGILWSDSQDQGRPAQLQTAPLEVPRGGFTELKATFTPPLGLDSAQVLLIAADPVIFDRFSATLRSSAPQRVRRLRTAGLEARVDADGHPWLLGGGRTLVSSIDAQLLGEGPCAPLASQATALTSSGPRPQYDSEAARRPGGELPKPIGYTTQTQVLAPAGAAAAAITSALTLQQGAIEWKASLETLPETSRLAARLRIPSRVIDGARMTREGRADPPEVEARVPFDIEGVTEISFLQGGSPVSLRLTPACRVTAKSSTGSVTVRLSPPAGSTEVRMTLAAGSSRDLRVFERLKGELAALIEAGRLEEARKHAGRIQRDVLDAESRAWARREQNALVARAEAALQEAGMIERDIEVTGVPALLTGAESRCRFVIEAYPETRFAEQAQQLLIRIDDRRARLVGSRRVEAAGELYTSARGHISAGRYRLARLYLTHLIETYSDLNRFRQDAERDLDFVVRKIEEPGS